MDCVDGGLAFFSEGEFSIMTSPFMAVGANGPIDPCDYPYADEEFHDCHYPYFLEQGSELEDCSGYYRCVDVFNFVIQDVVDRFVVFGADFRSGAYFDLYL